MKEFDLEEAKKGAALMTRNGRRLRIVCFNRVDNKRHGHILALMLGRSGDFEMSISYDDEGHNLGSYDKGLDIMIDDGEK